MTHDDWKWTLQVPTGSKRPSPSPSDGEQPEAKKLCASPYDSTPTHDTLNQELPFSMVNFALDGGFGNPEAPYRSEGVYENQFDTPIAFNSGYIDSFPLSSGGYGGGFDYGLGNEALGMPSGAETYWNYTSHGQDQGGGSNFDPFPLGAFDIGDPFIGTAAGYQPPAETIPTDQVQAYEQPQQESPLDSPSTRPADVRKDYDTCFGVIISTPRSSWTSDNETRSIPVNLKALGNYFMLRTQISDKHVGILDDSRLVTILDQFSLRIDATLLIPEVSDTKEAQKLKLRKQKSTKPEGGYSIRIVLHGSQSDKESIGKLLSKSSLFLQHPYTTEVLPDTKYENPHYLLRPGAEMPNIEDLSQQTTADSSLQSGTEDETRTSDLLRLFATAEADGSTMPFPNPQLSSRLRTKLMSHQLTSLAFMLEKENGLLEKPVFPPLWTLERSEQGSKMCYRHMITRSLEAKPFPIMGGILADDMGLGKTLSVLALICSSLDMASSTGTTESAEKQSAHRTLIIAPKSAIYSWEVQASKHIEAGQLLVSVYHGVGRQNLASELSKVDVVITTYETLRSEHAAPSGTSPLYSSQWFRVVLDEAHHVRNRSSQAFTSVCRLRARYRWCLTGTPVHNSFDDYGSLLSFIRVYPFQEKSQFMSRIVQPLEEKKSFGVQRLQELIRATCLRRTKQKTLAHGSLTLPPRFETICEVNLHPDDQELYESVKKTTQELAVRSGQKLPNDATAQSQEGNIIVLLNARRLICDHGEQLLPRSMRGAMEKTLVPHTDRAQSRLHASACSTCGGEIDESILLTETHASLCSNCAASEVSQSDPVPPKDLEPRPLASAPGPASQGESELATIRPSAKVIALLKNLRRETEVIDSGCQPRRSVIFSYWVRMLDLIEEALRSAMIKYRRIDGKTSLEGRRVAVSEFSHNSDCSVMLASIGSAAEGIDLTAASLVHLMEPHWNPMVEAQAVDRVYRLGQTQQVTVIRYIVPNSVETYVRVVQEEKMHIINQTNMTTDNVQDDLSLKRKEALEKLLT